MDPTAARNFNAMCARDGSQFDCDGMDAMTLCLSTPSWNIQNDAIMFPYAWVEEGMTLSRDDADSLKDTLYWMDDFAEQLQLWCFVSAGILSAILFGMLYESYLLEKYNKEFIPGAFDDDVVAVYSKIPQGQGNAPNESLLGGGGDMIGRNDGHLLR